ncbi:hypothetical protein [Thermomonospora catenispora]|uniref:hypothetical protein n=1 Tax=Thermomonospora catenispora TaxID=2493090 RepID=UPI001124400F|nr:hypothetical protein [Thermomonospora catenispora]TNY38256.1 hypothetical protein EIO00_04410 [Thermomonospora catenispora]
MNDRRSARRLRRIAVAGLIGAAALVTVAPTAAATTASAQATAQPAAQAAAPAMRYIDWYFTYARCQQAGVDGKQAGRWSRWKCIPSSWNTHWELWAA